MKAVIELSSGKGLDLLNPDPDSIELKDIALGLSRQSRLAGRGNRFYSVTEHSLLVFHLLRVYLNQEILTEAEQKLALMHDAHEAFIRDISAPLKKHLPDYNQVTKRLDLALEKRFNLESFKNENVDRIDKLALSIEVPRIMNYQKDNWSSRIDERFIEAELKPIKLLSGFIYNPNLEYQPNQIYDLFYSELLAAF
jgi:hypothetical protein